MITAKLIYISIFDYWLLMFNFWNYQHVIDIGKGLVFCPYIWLNSPIISSFGFQRKLWCFSFGLDCWSWREAPKISITFKSQNLFQIVLRFCTFGFLFFGNIYWPPIYGYIKIYFQIINIETMSQKPIFAPCKTFCPFCSKQVNMWTRGPNIAQRGN